MNAEQIITIIGILVGSSALWEFLKWLITRKSAKKVDIVKKLIDIDDRLAKTEQMSLGSLYDRAKYIGLGHIERGWITLQEYEDFKKYLYNPYHNGGGDGTIDKIMQEIDELPIHKDLDDK